jgi:hypothetical protein
VRIARHNGPVCDFCLKPGPRWSFDCSHRHEIVALEGETSAGTSVPAASLLASIDYGKTWAACTRCSGLVARKNIGRLAEVAADSAFRHWGPSLGSRAEVVDLLLSLYRRFVPLMGERRLATKEELAEGGEFFVENVRAEEN